MFVDLKRPHCWHEEIQSRLGTGEGYKYSTVGGGVRATHKAQMRGPHQHGIPEDTETDGGSVKHHLLQHLTPDHWQ